MHALLAKRFEQGLWKGESAIRESGSRSTCCVMVVRSAFTALRTFTSPKQVDIMRATKSWCPTDSHESLVMRAYPRSSRLKPRQVIGVVTWTVEHAII